MTTEEAARKVMAIINNDASHTAGSVIHHDDIVRPWITQRPAAAGLDEALRYCVVHGWLVNHHKGKQLTDVGAAL